MQDNGASVSFERDIRPLFRDVDIDHMEGMGVLLADHTWMAGPFWSEEQLKKLADWMKGGYLP
jgi:hypothetical protein